MWGCPNPKDSSQEPSQSGPRPNACNSTPNNFDHFSYQFGNISRSPNPMGFRSDGEKSESRIEFLEEENIQSPSVLRLVDDQTFSLRSLRLPSYPSE